MRRNPVASRRYATALFEVTDKSREALDELKVFQAALHLDRGHERFFLSPVVSKDAKLEVIQDFKTKLPNIFLFLEALIEADRLEVFDGIVEEFQRLSDEKAGELSVELESAMSLSDASLEEIKGLLLDRWKKKLKVKVTVNPELIGGFVARAPGKLLDASVSSQLENLREEVFA